MSYCRFGEGDVYLYASVNGWECCSCVMASEPFTNTHLQTLQSVLEHLEAHRERGDFVPASAFHRVRREIKEAASSAASNGGKE